MNLVSVHEILECLTTSNCPSIYCCLSIVLLSIYGNSWQRHCLFTALSSHQYLILAFCWYLFLSNLIHLSRGEDSDELFWSKLIVCRRCCCRHRRRRKLFTFSSSSNQTWHKAYTVNRNQVSTNEEPCPFPRGDNYEIMKMH